ncbi:Gfo/Idh/MocA family protein [Paenibacillus sacheonensis]|uniref:Gfo/Idh/MocA family oxidoreductase n=1 Tax=Paenibacillus sacheonensis TaxID=742054 RepID=A0A7X5BY77_9BACL|nr:Gfo/Idh/MocA family oxidoreductase [Paenibacillus sacheonensis]MBM7564859.1 putative dehydrogenase [Paenibacillus sacheonensis]NBC69407.1 Gfo/Idh/MocA family oxidoreductase [Paenibacillus sacheonensis]
MTIKVGIVGARGLSTLQGFRCIEGAEVVALCDLDGDFLAATAAKEGIPRTYRIYEDMLDSDIDAVIISTPMQLHVPQAILALQAGKHVLSEVTAGVTMDELWWLKETAEQIDRVYMMAENYCYIPENQQILGMVKAGLFGDVYFGEGEYIHDVRSLAFRPSRSQPGEGVKPTWRSYWQLGKRGAFYPTHSLGPVMQWFGEDRIRSVSCFGTGWHTDTRFRQEDTSITLCQMESGKLIKLRIDCISRRPHNLNYYTLQGTKGCYEAPRGLGDTHKIWLEGMGDREDEMQWRPLSEYAEYLPERYRNVTEEQKSAGHWGGDYFIVEDFVAAVKGERKPAIDVYDACEWTAVAMLSELSVMNGGRAMEMPDFRKSASRGEQIIKL